jgi:hypothetical protein
MATETPRESAPRPAEEAAAQQQIRVRWDDTHMKSSYANVCNVASTREEVVLLFGVNQAWNTAQREIPVQLSDRIILSPHAAKRLSVLLNNVLREYEARFGALPAPGA